MATFLTIFADDEDYLAYLDWLKQATDQFGLRIHAYVLMTNHVHLLATPMEMVSVSKTLQSLGRRYVQYFNYQYGRTGTLWEGRYRATVIDTESYLLACSRYIEINPVRAVMVEAPGEYRWSSYRCNALGRADEWVTLHALYQGLGRSAELRQSAYRALFAGTLTDGLLCHIRAATNEGWALGSERFRNQVEAVTARRASPLPRGRPKKVDADP